MNFQAATSVFMLSVGADQNLEAVDHLTPIRAMKQYFFLLRDTLSEVSFLCWLHTGRVGIWKTESFSFQLPAP